MKAIAALHSQCRSWVKTGKPQCEHMFSAMPPRADIAPQSRHVRFEPTTDLCTAAIASFIQSPRSARASSEGGMVSPTSPDMRLTYLDATEHPGTVQEYKIMSAPGIVISTVNWLILGASQDWT